VPAGDAPSADIDLAVVVHCIVLQDEVGVYRFVTEDPNKATFRNLVIKPPCMLW
jgi:hypothetical protein